jgi:hypothetical protein
MRSIGPEPIIAAVGIAGDAPSRLGESTVTTALANQSYDAKAWYALAVPAGEPLRRLSIRCGTTVAESWRFCQLVATRIGKAQR